VIRYEVSGTPVVEDEVLMVEDEDRCVHLTLYHCSVIFFCTQVEPFLLAFESFLHT
jgi:hypothetical protein